jgi:ribonuclease VapC
MVVDSSALVALLLGEPETSSFVAAIGAASRRFLSAASYVVTAIEMMARSGPATLAITAYQQYGKGRGQAAGLNFGDCFTYALAKLRNEPVLFKGNDFSRTDLRIAVGP